MMTPVILKQLTSKLSEQRVSLLKRSHHFEHNAY